jgi:hypothetical protein
MGRTTLSPRKGMRMFRRATSSVTSAAVLLALAACSKKFTEADAYALLGADGEPKAIACTVHLDRVFMESSFAAASGMGVTVGELHTSDETAGKCLKYVAAAGGLLDLKSNEHGPIGAATTGFTTVHGFPKGSWNSDRRNLTFECGHWSKVHVDSITTHDGKATAMYSREPVPNGGDAAFKAVPSACEPHFDMDLAKGTLRAVLDDSGRWQVER